MDIERFKFSLLASLTILEPMLIGLIFKQNQLGSIGAFGTLCLMYYKPFQRLYGLRNVFVFCLFAFGVCFLEVCFNLYIFSVILISFTSIFLHYCGYVWNWGPGPFFFVMITSMFAGMTSKMSFSSMFLVLIYLLIGMLLACFNSIIFTFMGTNSKTLYFDNYSGRFPRKSSSFVYGITILIALIVSGLIHGPFSYWITVGCAAVLQAYGYIQTIIRYVSYNVGGFVGVLLASLLLHLNYNRLLVVFIIAIIMGIVTYFINSFYQFAICFTTPLTIMIVSLNRGSYFNQILKFRLLDVIIGSAIGFIVISLIVIAKRFNKL